MRTICQSGFKMSVQDQKSLAHYLLETPEQWAKSALKGMINKAVKTILRDWLDKYKVLHPEGISGQLSVLIPAVIQMPGFIPYNQEASEKEQAPSKNGRNIETWPAGFVIEDWEFTALQAFYGDVEQTLRYYMENKIAKRKKAFVKEHEQKFLGKEATIPSHPDDMIDFATVKVGYKNRAQQEADAVG